MTHNSYFRHERLALSFEGGFLRRRCGGRVRLGARRGCGGGHAGVATVRVGGQQRKG